MCGIIGFASSEPDDLSEKLLDGLSRLEYRGYDSAGIALLVSQKIKLWKSIGEVSNLKNKVKKQPQCSLGLAHTRWATHGGVTARNAHPHVDCTESLALVHNGIVENFEELKAELGRIGHKFKSETDTEVIVHLIEEELKRVPDFFDATRAAFKRLHGLNAIVAINLNGEMVGFRKGSPLSIGIDENSFIVCSDIPVLTKYTEEVILLGEEEGFAIKDVSLRIIDKSGNTRKPEATFVQKSQEIVGKGQYPHYMLKEIFEVPDVLLRVAENDKDTFFKAAGMIKRASDTFLTACGTAGYACVAASYMFSDIAKKQTNFCVASEFPYFDNFLVDKSLLIAASQSGETMDTLEAVRASQKRGAKILAVVNVINSSLDRVSDVTINLLAGPEYAVVSTKAYIAKLATFLILAYSLVGKYDKGVSLVKDASRESRKIFTVENLNKIKKLARKLKSSKSIYMLGRGYNYPTAMEAALKLKESSYVPSEGFAGGELKHGFLALIEKGTPCFVFVARDAAYKAILGNAMEVKSRGGYIIGVAKARDEIFDEWIKVPEVQSASPIIDIIPMQLFAYYLAVEKGLNPDKPRNLAKSVTVK